MLVILPYAYLRNRYHMSEAGRNKRAERVRMLVRGIVFTAFLMTCNVCLSGLVAFGYWEPLADQLEGVLGQSFLHGFEDVICLMLLFSLTFLVLRWLTNMLAPTHMTYHPVILQGGGAFFGLVTGYLVSGFLVAGSGQAQAAHGVVLLRNTNPVTIYYQFEWGENGAGSVAIQAGGCPWICPTS